jgi:hypothetical protein
MEFGMAFAKTKSLEDAVLSMCDAAVEVVVEGQNAVSCKEAINLLAVGVGYLSNRGRLIPPRVYDVYMRVYGRSLL